MTTTHLLIDSPRQHPCRQYREVGGEATTDLNGVDCRECLHIAIDARERIADRKLRETALDRAIACTDRIDTYTPGIRVDPDHHAYGIVTMAARFESYLRDGKPAEPLHTDPPT